MFFRRINNFSTTNVVSKYFVVWTNWLKFCWKHCALFARHECFAWKFICFVRDFVYENAANPTRLVSFRTSCGCPLPYWSVLFKNKATLFWMGWIMAKNYRFISYKNRPATIFFTKRKKSFKFEHFKADLPNFCNRGLPMPPHSLRLNAHDFFI